MFTHVLDSRLTQLVMHPGVELGKDRMICHEFKLKIGDVQFEIAFFQVQSGSDHTVGFNLMKKERMDISV